MKKSTEKTNQTAFDQSMIADGIQVIGTAADFMSGKTPRMRELTLDDITDNCPVCVVNRKRILAGDPPMAMVFDH